MFKKSIINFWKSELERPNCYYCGAKKVIGDWTPMTGEYASNGESWWYRPYGCPSPQCSFRYKESLISCTTSYKDKADKMLNRKLYGYKINFTNMGIIKNTIKIIVVLVAIFVVVNVFWWLFGGMIHKFPQIIITKTIKVPTEKIVEVPTEKTIPCDEGCAIKILESSNDNHWIGYAIEQKWSLEKSQLKQINCGNLPTPHPKQECEADYK